MPFWAALGIKTLSSVTNTWHFESSFEKLVNSIQGPRAADTYYGGQNFLWRLTELWKSGQKSRPRPHLTRMSHQLSVGRAEEQARLTRGHRALMLSTKRTTPVLQRSWDNPSFVTIWDMMFRIHHIQSKCPLFSWLSPQVFLHSQSCPNAICHLKAFSPASI